MFRKKINCESRINIKGVKILEGKKKHLGSICVHNLQFYCSRS